MESWLVTQSLNVYFLVLLISLAGTSAEDKCRQLQCSYLPVHLFSISEFVLKIPL